MRLFLLRHGNTFEDGEPSRQVGALTDVPLTTKGRAQARSAAAWLKAHDAVPTTVYCGRLKRQKETAEILSEALGAPVVETDALLELAHGAWENLTIEELKTRFPDSYRAWSEAGEWPAEFEGSFEEARRRISDFLDMTLAAHGDGETVAAVTSQGAMKVAASLVAAERWEELKASRGIGEFKVKTGAFCELSHMDGAWKLVAWNVVPE